MLTYPETSATVESKGQPLTVWFFCTYLAPVFFWPMLVLQENKEAMRLLFCVCVTAISWTFERLHFVAASLLPLILLPVLGIMPADDVATTYVSEPVVALFVGVSLFLAVGHGTSLYTRLSLLLLRGFGTRVRSLLLAFLGCTLLLTQVLGSGLAAVAMVCTAECAIAMVHSDVIRENQFKAYAQKLNRRRFSSAAGGLLGRMRQRSSRDSGSATRTQDVLRRQRPARSSVRSTLPIAADDSSMFNEFERRVFSVTIGNSPDNLLSGSQTDSGNRSPCSAAVPRPASGGERRGTVRVNMDGVPVFLASKPPPWPAAAVPAEQPGSASAKRNAEAARDRKISIYERGKTRRPGDEEQLTTDAHVHAPSKKGSIFGGIRDFIKRRLTTSTFMESSYLQERIAWEKERYAAIRKDLLIGIALTASVGSITSFHGNESTFILSKYYGSTCSDRKELTTSKWLLVTAPVAISSMAFAWCLLMMGYLERYDADEDEDARHAINRALKHKYYEISAFSFRECLISLLTLAWFVGKFAYAHEETLTEDRFRHAPSSLLVSRALFVVLFALPPELLSWGGARETLLSWSQLASSMPWGVLVVYGAVHCLMAASRVSGLWDLASESTLWMRDMDPVTNQLILTAAASVLGELTSSTATSAMLVPIAVGLAQQRNTHPLYLAIPVTVASSTSMLTPISSTAVTIVVSYAEIRVADLLVPALMIKAFTITSVLLSINTVGEFVFDFESAYDPLTRFANDSQI
ncbi:uncharacterized protein LOC144144290 [Haemaphysalis longicornis]